MEKSMTNIFEAIRTNNLEALKEIIESGSFDPNEIDTSEHNVTSVMDKGRREFKGGLIFSERICN
jgi:hypothetical protein